MKDSVKIELSAEEMEKVLDTLENPPKTSEKLLEAVRKMKEAGGFYKECASE